VEFVLQASGASFSTNSPAFIFGHTVVWAGEKLQPVSEYGPCKCD
jgi:hypothetical protein